MIRMTINSMCKILLRIVVTNISIGDHILTVYADHERETISRTYRQLNL
jgi:hypothetical protein